jgi:hypothetical protein
MRMEKLVVLRMEILWNIGNPDARSVMLTLHGAHEEICDVNEPEVTGQHVVQVFCNRGREDGRMCTYSI